ncbi:MAG: membrane protein insertase YidC [Muribaculaceae bacterium]|nr:membrane protein insertase YidC [Muribaculaceae bacterium]
MDKNTLTGMLLMVLVIFGFMWFNKPSEAEIKAKQEAIEEAARQQAAQAAAPAISVISAEEAARIIPTVQTYGHPVEGNPGTVALVNDDLNLTYTQGDSLVSGTVRVGDKSIDVRRILANDLLDYTPEQAQMAHNTLRSAIGNINKYKSFAQFLGGENKTTVLENDQMRVTFASKGGCIRKVELKKYLNETTTPATDVVLFDNETNKFNITFTTSEQHIHTADLNFRTVAVTDSSLTMALPLSAGVDWQIRYTLVPDIYIVKMEVIQRGISAVIPPSTTTVSFDWAQQMMRNEGGRTFEERNSTVAYKFVDEGSEELKADKADDKHLVGRISWVAFKNQFFSSVVIPRQAFTTADVTCAPIKDSTVFLKDMSLAASMPYSSADGSPLAFDFYFGPNDYPLLSSLDDKLSPRGDDLDLNNLVPLGWTLFRWVNKIIVIPIFTFLGQHFTNYGIVILLLTLIIKLILFPFTYKSFVSQAKMKILAPEIKEINEKYPGQENAMKRQQETMALYSRAGASPFSGCLPMLLQMPVLIALFAFFPSAIELRGQSFLWAHNLAAPDYICTLPFTIPFYGNKVSLFCLLMTATNIIYMYVTMQNNPSQNQMPGMKWMMYIMPVMFLFIFNDYASGLSYYYFLSLLITIVQTYVIRHFIISEDKVRAQMAENAKKPKKKSGFMARLEEAQKQQEALMRQQAKQQAKRRR